MTTSLELLQDLFKDRPDALTIFTLESLEADKIKDKLRNSNELFAANVNMYVTGQTGAGKTALGNCLLSKKKVMKSTGFQDCTKSVGWFKLASNLRYYDLPGVASDGDCENVNRVALLIPKQIEDEFADPNPVNPLTESDRFDVLDFSNCNSEEDKPEKDNCPVGQWQSTENQKLVAPDVIIYVKAPHTKFLREEQGYLGELLKTWKERKQKCVVITALNIFRKEDGTIVPTPQEMEGARTIIAKVYRLVHKDEWIPPIVEINSQTGEGIERLTEIICQVLPGNKIGNMQTVLKDELKQYAEKERSNRYYRNLGLIAGRLSRYTVDKKIAGQSLLSAAASAISSYGVMTFKGIETVADLRNQIDDVVQKAEQIEKGQAQNITETKDVIGKKDITRIKPKIEERPVEVTKWELVETPETGTETIPVLETDIKTLESTQYVPKSPDLVEWKWEHGLKDIVKTETYTDSKGKTKKREYWERAREGYEEKKVTTQVPVTNTILKDVPKKGTRRDLVPKTSEEMQKQIVGYEEEVVGTIDAVVAQIEEVVGTKYLSGGYPAIQFLLGIGLGVQNHCLSNSADWQTSYQKGELKAEQILSPYKSKIEQLVEIPEGENELVKILETALIGANSPTALGGK